MDGGHPRRRDLWLGPRPDLLACFEPSEGRFAYMTHVLGGMALDRPPRPPRVRTLLGTTPAWVDHVVGGVA